MIKDFSFFIWNDSVCFLLKKAVVIPLKNSRKRKNNVFLRGNCFCYVLFPYLSSGIAQSCINARRSEVYLSGTIYCSL